jgi:hypothetical protein
MLPEELEAQARSVTHLATYLEELQDAARRLRERAAVRERGYAYIPGYSVMLYSEGCSSGRVLA